MRGRLVGMAPPSETRQTGQSDEPEPAPVPASVADVVADVVRGLLGLVLGLSRVVAPACLLGRGNPPEGQGT